MKNVITLFLIVIMFFTFCKKKETKTEEPPATNSTTGSITTGGGDYGVFLSVYNTFDFGNNSFFNDSTVQASFYDSPLSTHTAIKAGTVSVNSTTLASVGNNVYSNNNQINLKSLNWQVSGSGTITPGSFSYSPVYPSYNGGGSLPDSVSQASGTSFVVNGIANTNKPIYVTISQTSSLTKTLSTIPATITLSQAELTQFTSGSYITIRLSMFNYSNITFNSHQYAINANRTYQKSTYLKP